MAGLFPAVSDSAALVDRSLIFIIGTSLAILALVTFLMLFFVFKYNRKRHPRADNPSHEGSRLIEIGWVAAATLLVLLMFWFGWRDFDYLRTAPANALPVQVLGREWSWLFTYPNGKESAVLKVPLNLPTRLAMTSLDVIHSVYIPAFRIKEDVVPGMTTHLWFTPRQLGSYDLFCTEYCGVGHSHMRAVVEVVTPEAFNAWLVGEAVGPASGIRLLVEKGCADCHSTDGSPKDGPTLRGLFGSTVSVRAGGVERRMPADEEYLRRAIQQPQAEIVEGFQPIMPDMTLTPAELEAIVDAIKSLAEAPR